MSTSFSPGYPQAPAGGIVASGEAWGAVQAALAQRMSAFAFRTYVAPALVLESAPLMLKLGYPSPFLADWVRDNYRATFEEELLAVTNRRVKIELAVNEVVEPEPEEAPKASLKLVRGAVQPVGPGEPVTPRRSSNGLDSRYTFSSYVVGGSNQFAYAACKAVADGPGRTYNPLFLWGGVGLGKTHLMQAVGHMVLEADPKQRVLYTTSEEFTNDLISAIRANKMQDFRRRYRDCDVLLIDDVQFLAGKPATEEEFFHTFNALHSAGKQIIVSSDSFPHEIKEMEERLRSRFQWGLIADIQPPELETRVAILKTKAAAMQLVLDDEVAQFLGTHVRTNVREIEGALVRVGAFANIMRGPITIELCKNVLRSILANRGEKLDVDQIIKACADYFKLSVAELKSPVRKQHLARARQVAMYLSRNLTKASFPQLGEKFEKDHSTIINAMKRVPELMQEDEQFRRDVEALERELGSQP